MSESLVKGQETLGVVRFGTSPSLIHYSEAPFKGKLE
jgi:hypothetical protein